MIIPPSLRKGDRVRIVSPAGAVDPAYVEGAMQTLCSWGLRAEASTHALGRFGRFAATADERLADLREAVADDEVRAVLCSRGGYGAVQLLEGLDADLVRRHPKWLIGYSDVTLLHAFWNRAGVASLHAPMAKHLAERPADEASLALRRALTEGPAHLGFAPHKLNIEGKSEGHLAGGNLAVLSALHATPYDFDYRGAVLFIEDIAESPYKIERMIYSLRLSGAMRELAGLVVGQFTECNEDPLLGLTIYEDIRRLAADCGIPVCFDAPVGHVDRSLPLVEGARVELSVGPQDVRIRYK